MTLRAIMHRELLVVEAARQGFRSTSTEAMGMAESARRNLAGAAKQLGLVPIVIGEDEDRRTAVGRTVTDLMTRLLSGEQRRVTPLGAMSYVLRVQFSHGVFESGVAEASRQVEAARSGGG